MARRRAKDARTDLAKAGGAELVVISIMPGNAAKENCFAPIQMKSACLRLSSVFDDNDTVIVDPAAAA
jgi:hypothetical protein